MKLAISIEGMCGLTWPTWKLLVTEVGCMGFAGLFRSDHFTLLDPPDLDSLELIVSLTYLASQNQSIHFGSLVSPLSFRDPIMLARQAMALDDLSEGRMILGVGAGWVEREHKMFGYSLGDVRTRMDRFEEGLAVISGLIRSDDTITYQGHYYQLQEAHLLPRPKRHTPILVGGNGPKRTLPLVARYADIWNCQVASRQKSDVKRTVMIPVICWTDNASLDNIMNAYRQVFPGFAPLPTEEIIGILKNYFAAVTGTPDSVIEQMQVYEKAGAEEMMIQWIIIDHIAGLEIIAKNVLPHFGI
jgi:alkanesulfonate monooxygenase SsuD/methylene tetrahydromethanopterin reductase-like flavin-dependent oxidoreductase (luciferase family)